LAQNLAQGFFGGGEIAGFLLRRRQRQFGDLTAFVVFCGGKRLIGEVYRFFSAIRLTV